MFCYFWVLNGKINRQRMRRWGSHVRQSTSGRAVKWRRGSWLLSLTVTSVYHPLMCVTVKPRWCRTLTGRGPTCTDRYWSLIDEAVREAAVLRGIQVRLLISFWEETHPLTINFVTSLQTLCMQLHNCSIEAVCAHAPVTLSLFLSLIDWLIDFCLLVFTEVFQPQDSRCRQHAWTQPQQVHGDRQQRLHRWGVFLLLPRYNRYFYTPNIFHFPLNSVKCTCFFGCFLTVFFPEQRHQSFLMSPFYLISCWYKLSNSGFLAGVNIKSSINVFSHVITCLLYRY